MTIEQLKLPIDRLIVDAVNVRKTKVSKADDDALDASILAHGILMPIAVRPPAKSDADILGERYRVSAGARRYAAISRLIEAGKLKADFEIPVLVREDMGDAEAEEASLAENIIRAGMTAVDEVRAFHRLREAGSNVGEIAFRFGVTERAVKARLALAELHPDILAALESGEISLAVAQAYTVGSIEKQEEIFRSNVWWKNQPESIKNAMTRSDLRGSDPLAQKIGRDRYLAAGGSINGDLFGDSEWWIDAHIVDKLKAELVDELKAKVLADGWGWCMTEEELGKPYYQLERIHAKTVDLRTEEQKERHQEVSDALEAYDVMDQEEAEADENFVALTAEYEALDKLESNRGYSAEQKRAAGVIIGERFDLLEGMLKPGDKDPGEVGGAGASASSATKPEKDPLAPSAALQERLSKQLTNAIREAILKDTHVALAFLATALSPDVHKYSVATASHIKHHGYDGQMEDAKSFSEVLTHMLLRSDDEIIAQLVEHVSSSVDVSDPFLTRQGWGFRGDACEELRATLVSATKADPVAHFEARDFFAASSKAVIEAAMKDMGEVLAPGKKESLVNQAEAFAERYGWLPEFLRFDGYKLNKPEPIEHKKGPTFEAKTKDQHDTKTAIDVTKGTGKAAAKAAATKPKGTKAIKVDADVISVLADKTEIIDGKWLVIKEQLPRDLYAKVNKVLKALGGTWLRREQKHVFEDDVSEIFEEVIQTGEYSRTKQDFGQFDTPYALAEQLVELAEIEDGMSVLEPSAGIGGLVTSIMEKGGWVTAIEIDETRASKLVADVIEPSELHASQYAEVNIGDFMTWDEGLIFDRVVMNPPFAGQADIDHVLRAWEFLKPGGILAAIMSPSFQFRTNRKSNDFRQFLYDYEAEVHAVPEGAFKESGTMIRTIMVKIRKPEGE